MKRTILMILGVLCGATVAAELVAVGVLWVRGDLTSETIAELGDVLANEPEEDLEEDPATSPPSSEELTVAIVRARLDLENRDREFQLLVEMLEERRKKLDEDRAAFRRASEAFEKRLADLDARSAAEGTEQARGILKAVRPEEAVVQLGPLELEETLIILQGLPDKTIAGILQQFTKSNDEELRQRGLDLFEALSRGEPKRSLVDETADADGTETERPRG